MILLHFYFLLQFRFTCFKNKYIKFNSQQAYNRVGSNFPNPLFTFGEVRSMHLTNLVRPVELKIKKI